jgi:hypothetical protein
MTKKTVHQWTRSIDDINSDHPGLKQEKIDYVTAAMTAGETDGLANDDKVNFVGYRLWSDETSAQKWIDFITATAAKYNEPVTVRIENI